MTPMVGGLNGSHTYKEPSGKKSSKKFARVEGTTLTVPEGSLAVGRADQVPNKPVEGISRAFVTEDNVWWDLRERRDQTASKKFNSQTSLSNLC